MGFREAVYWWLCLPRRSFSEGGSAAEWDYLARQRCQCWSHHKPLMMHRVYEAACSGGSACLEHE